ncbi:unnamed protein product [marine sediment metagenome]|uniref:Uncharacterized protein n=1 Tax=marine sediment metagenome TaxID=412755 RepID=X1RA60_9ZZZZ
MFEKVETKEIENIKERLKTELKDKNLPFQRKEEIMSLLYHLDTWLEGRAYQEREHYREQLKSEN